MKYIGETQILRTSCLLISVCFFCDFSFFTSLSFSPSLSLILRAKKRENFKLLLHTSVNGSSNSHKMCIALQCITMSTALHCTAHVQNTWINNQAKSPCSANDPFNVIASVPVNKHWIITTMCHIVLPLFLMSNKPFQPLVASFKQYFRNIFKYIFIA